MPDSSKKSFALSFMFLLLCFGFMMKLRNIANTAHVTTTGGIWNIVTIVLYVYWFFLFLQKRVHVRRHGFWGTMFCFTAILSSLLYMKTLSVSFVYNLATLPYFLIILSLFTELSKEHGLSKRDLFLFFVTFLVLSGFVAAALLNYQNLPREERYLVTDVYYPLNMLPLLLLIKNKPAKTCAVIFTGFILILSGKRTGLVAMLLGLFLYYVLTAYCSRSLKEKGKTVLGMLIIGFLIFFLFTFLVEAFDLPLLERLELAFTEGESGRNAIWGKAFDGIGSAPFHKLLLGHGLKSLPVYIGSKNALAHCDYLEILFDHGILTLLFYITFWIAMLRKIVWAIKTKSEYAPNLVFSFVIAMFLSTFSNFVIDATYITYCMISFGIFFGLSERKEAMRREPNSTNRK